MAKLTYADLKRLVTRQAAVESRVSRLEGRTNVILTLMVAAMISVLTLLVTAVSLLLKGVLGG